MSSFGGINHYLSEKNSTKPDMKTVDPNTKKLEAKHSGGFFRKLFNRTTGKHIAKNPKPSS